MNVAFRLPERALKAATMLAAWLHDFRRQHG
jgi:hypothetical protein